MKPEQSIVFERPKQVLQVFRWHSILDKDAYRRPEAAAGRKQVWQQPEESFSGFVENQKLILPQNILEKVDFEIADLLLLEDGPDRSWVRCLTAKTARRSFGEFFKIGTKEGEPDLWLSFHYAGTVMMGYPERDNFDLGPLRPDRPLRILVNGRTKHSAAGFGRPTKYREWDFVFQHLGAFEEAELRPQPVTLKTIPEAKLIDLRKTLF